MNFGVVEVDETTQQFWREVRAFLDEAEDSVIEHEWETGDGVNVELHRQLGEKGWLIPALPIEQGGIGHRHCSARSWRRSCFSTACQ